MGNIIEINDTLQLTIEQGFPSELNVDQHQRQPHQLEDVKNRVFVFIKEDRRLYHLHPTRVFLVQNINGKWLYWGHAMILEETIDPIANVTRGTFRIIKIFDPAYQRMTTIHETPEGKSYF